MLLRDSGSQPALTLMCMDLLVFIHLRRRQSGLICHKASLHCCQDVDVWGPKWPVLKQRTTHRYTPTPEWWMDMNIRLRIEAHLWRSGGADLQRRRLDVFIGGSLVFWRKTCSGRFKLPRCFSSCLKSRKEIQGQSGALIPTIKALCPYKWNPFIKLLVDSPLLETWFVPARETKHELLIRYKCSSGPPGVLLHTRYDFVCANSALFSLCCQKARLNQWVFQHVIVGHLGTNNISKDLLFGCVFDL